MKTYVLPPTTIKSWAEEDRPREKMSLKGRLALSDAELIAILLGSGSRNESALDLAKRVLAAASNNLHTLSELSLPDLQKFKGIGEAKAITIAAALELGRRRQAVAPAERPQITSSNDAYRVLVDVLTDLPHEEFWILLLNRANRVTHRCRISEGGQAGTVVDTKKIFQRVLAQERTASIILAHNHPSGNLTPSQADLDITRRIKDAGKVLDVAVLDHLIIGNNAFMSFADQGYL